MRALLDFLYLAQLPSHTTDTIRRLEDTLESFHQNKDVFIDLGVCDHFNVPKVHSLLHYGLSIVLFGTTDNYNTEQTERLHIDFTKDAYRATNRKDELKQMTTWLERRKRVQHHAAFVNWRQQQVHPVSMLSRKPIGPPCPVRWCVKMTQHPTIRRVPFEDLIDKYGATHFLDILGDFIAHLQHPNVSERVVRTCGVNTLIPFGNVPVFHKIKFVVSGGTEVMDTIQIRPEQVDAHGRTIPRCFDTVLVQDQRLDAVHGKEGEIQTI